MKRKESNTPAGPPSPGTLQELLNTARDTLTATEAGRDAAVFALEFLNAPGVDQNQRGALVTLVTMIFHGQTVEIRQAAAEALNAAAGTSDKDPARGPALMVKVFRG